MRLIRFVFTPFLMEILEAIYTRRSIRKFEFKDVSDDILQNILRAGMSAPNSGGQRLWQFVVVKDRDQMEKIIDAYPYAKPFASRKRLLLLVQKQLLYLRKSER
ncbi:MAG: nitroreductase family protein [Candidatus Thorarchaeota archaeon]|nr:nitroreductase family protein [Candidatus Thorarchaeota archaeon]